MKRTPSAMARHVGDELVILDPTTGAYFGLNDVGALVWKILANDCATADLIGAVQAKYDVDSEMAATDVERLVQQLLDANLITP